MRCQFDLGGQFGLEEIVATCQKVSVVDKSRSNRESNGC